MCQSKLKSQSQSTSDHSKPSGDVSKRSDNSKSFKQHFISDTTSTSFDSDLYDLFQLSTINADNAIVLNVHLNDISIQMELDTGASVSIISLATYNHLQSSPLESSDIKLKTYSGEVINVLGSI